MAKNVLVSFKSDSQEDTLLEVTCRPSGIMNFIFSLLKIVPLTTLKASRTSMDFEQVTLFRQESVTTPLNHISTLQCGRSRNWKLLVWALLFLILGVKIAKDSSFCLIVCLLLMAGCLVLYYISSSFYIAFTPDSGHTYAIQFHSSIIGGELVDLEKVKSACANVRRVVLETK